MRQLRDYQESAVNKIRTEWSRGIVRTVIVHATGLGKTSIIAKLATDEAAAGGRVLLLAHRSEPLDQMTDCCLETDPTISVGRIQAERNEINHRITVASVQTLCHDNRMAQLHKPTMVIIDECFPAGTMIGDTPIEQIRTGDLVPSWDEITNQPVQRRVTATMRSVPSSLVHVQTENESIVCTPGHPFLTTSGWVPAIELNHGAHVLSSTYGAATSLLHRVQNSIRSTQPAQGKMADLAQTTTSVLSRQLPSLLGASTEAEAKNTETNCSLYSLRRSSQLSRTAKTSIPRMAEYWTSLLHESMPRCLGKSTLVSHNDQNESQTLFSSNDQEQPYARCRDQSQDASNSTQDQTSTSTTRRQWITNARSSANASSILRMANRSNLHNTHRRTAVALQTGHRALNNESLRRSRWSIAHSTISTESRQEERRTADLSRVVSVQVLEPGSDGTYGGVCPRGVVYNLEVEGTHIYRVGRSGLVAHNCHHGMATSYIKILSWAGSFETTRTLGVTATLVRGDGRGFGELFQSVADSKGIDWAVRHRWLVPPRGKAVLLRNLDLAGMTVRHGDYADSELGPAIDAGSEAIVKAWQNNAGDRITVAFTPTIASAHALRAAFMQQGIDSEVVIGSTPRDDRKAIYARLAAGATRVLVSVMVTTEAWDCPPVSCVLMARPTALPGLYQQMMGRGLRLADDKTDCLVLDVVGVSRGQKLITLVNMVPSALYDDSEIRPRRRRSAAVRPRIVQRVRDWLFSRGY
jgi:superfamily II DNA or RNA helicase